MNSLLQNDDYFDINPVNQHNINESDIDHVNQHNINESDIDHVNQHNINEYDINTVNQHDIIEYAINQAKLEQKKIHAQKEKNKRQKVQNLLLQLKNKIQEISPVFNNNSQFSTLKNSADLIVQMHCEISELENTQQILKQRIETRKKQHQYINHIINFYQNN